MAENEVKRTRHPFSGYKEILIRDPVYARRKMVKREKKEDEDMSSGEEMTGGAQLTPIQGLKVWPDQVVTDGIPGRYNKAMTTLGNWYYQGPLASLHPFYTMDFSTEQWLQMLPEYKDMRRRGEMLPPIPASSKQRRVWEHEFNMKIMDAIVKAGGLDNYKNQLAGAPAPAPAPLPPG